MTKAAEKTGAGEAKAAKAAAKRGKAEGAKLGKAKPDLAERALRGRLIALARWMNASGLNQGTSGNLSARHGETMLITPSGVSYDALEPEMIAAMPLGGDAGPGAWEGPLKPSTEWRFHRDILRARPEAGGVVHTHSPHATALAMTRREIPACHYMTAALGGAPIRCAPYATFGTQALSDHVVAALEGRSAALMASHGMVALGPTPEKAMAAAVELEALARQYVLSLSIGGPVLLSQPELEEAAAAMRAAGYGAASAG